MNFVVIDVETANPNFASICQIGIAPFRNGVPEQPRQWLVNPQDYFDPINVSIHGIDEDTVRSAPTWPEVYATIAPLLIGNIVASHTAFDRAALRQACGTWNLSTCECRWLDTARMEQIARNVTMEGTGFLAQCRCLLHDRDSKYCSSFCQVIEAANVKSVALPPKSPNLNAFAERWVRSVKEECLSKLILFGERSLTRALHHYQAHYHQQRNHQGKDNKILLPWCRTGLDQNQRKVRRRERLGGLLKYYERDAA